MKKLIIILTILTYSVSLTGCAALQPKRFKFKPTKWDTKDKVMAVTLLTLSTIDVSQTNNSIGKRGFIELNPVLPKKPSKETIIIGALLLNAAIIGAAHLLPKYRSANLGVTTGFQVCNVWRNNEQIERYKKRMR